MVRVSLANVQRQPAVSFARFKIADCVVSPGFAGHRPAGAINENQPVISCAEGYDGMSNPFAPEIDGGQGASYPG